jgi:hypothetical protein
MMHSIFSWVRKMVRAGCYVIASPETWCWCGTGRGLSQIHDRKLRTLEVERRTFDISGSFMQL